MTNFKITLLLSTLLLLSACSTTKQVTALKKPSIVEKAPNLSKVITKLKTSMPDISGNYSLVKGAYIYSNGSLALQNTIEASSLVIEKLDQNNFGYYYVTKIEGLTTQGYFGGFTYKDGQFYQKVINYPTTDTTLRDNINLTSTKNSLKLTVNTINAKRIIHWKKEKNLNNTHVSLAPALKEEKKAYLELFKDRLFPRQQLSMR
jgi:hypothetical protein